MALHRLLDIHRPSLVYLFFASYFLPVSFSDLEAKGCRMSGQKESDNAMASPFRISSYRVEEYFTLIRLLF